MRELIYKVKGSGSFLMVNKEESIVKVSGILGDLEKKFSGEDLVVYSNKIYIKSKVSFYTFRGMLLKMLKGVSEGYFVELEFRGLGYRFINLKDNFLLKVGFSHYIRINKVNHVHMIGFRNRLIIFGLDLEEVNRIGGAIKLLRKVDAYKGKGIWYSNDKVSIKVGKQR